MKEDEEDEGTATEKDDNNRRANENRDEKKVSRRFLDEGFSESDLQFCNLVSSLSALALRGAETLFTTKVSSFFFFPQF